MFTKCFVDKVAQATTPRRPATDDMECDKTQEQSEKADESETISEV